MNLRRMLLVSVGLMASGVLAASSGFGQVGTVLWKFDLANVSGAFVTVGPDGTVYTTDQTRLWAIAPAGNVRWSFDQAGGGRPVDFLPDGRLVVAAGYNVWALDAATGTVSWTFTWTGGNNHQIDNGPSVGPDGNIYATTAVEGSQGMGVFSLNPAGQLRWQDSGTPALQVINASHEQRIRFTQNRAIFGFTATTGPPSVYAYDFNGNQTNLVNYTCTSSPQTNGVDRLLMAGQCGVTATDLSTDTVVWNVGLGPVNMLPVSGPGGVTYSGRWHGPVSAISATGQVLWTSPDIGLQRTLGISATHQVFVYAGETFGQPNWVGALNASDGSALWQIPLETVGPHNELAWSNEAAFSPDEAYAYFTTRFTSNGAPGRLWAVQIAESNGPPVGESYCDPAEANSTGFPGVLKAFGSHFAADNSLILTVESLPTGEFGYFLNGTHMGVIPNPGGSAGNLCLGGGSIGRYNQIAEIFQTDTKGMGALVLDLTQTPTHTQPAPIVAGQTLQFQAWYRDTTAVTSNFTNGVSVSFQ